MAPAWEIALATGLTAVLIAALVMLSGRIYANAVLRMGSCIRLRDAFRSVG